MAKHLASTGKRAGPTIAKLLNKCAQERVVSVTRCSSLAQYGQETWRSYDIPKLVARASMDARHSTVFVTGRKRLVSHTDDYEHRPAQLADVCEYTMCSTYEKVTRRGNLGRSPLDFGPDHPQHKTHVLCERTRVACPVIYGVPAPQSVLWKRFVIALFTPGRSGSGDECALGEFERHVVRNIRARLLAPRDLPLYRGADDDDTDDAALTFTRATPADMTDYTRAALASAVPLQPLAAARACEAAPVQHVGADDMERIKGELVDAREHEVPRTMDEDVGVATIEHYTDEQLSVDAGLGPEQKDVAERIVRATAHFGQGEPLRLLVHGEAGTGKSKLVDAVMRTLGAIGLGDTVLLTAYTGAAAQLLARSAPAHTTSSAFKLGYRVQRGGASWKATEHLQQRWKRVRTLIVDEVSFVSVEHNQALKNRMELAAKDRDVDSPWNIIYIGDFYQHAPPGSVARHRGAVIARMADYFNLCAQRCLLCMSSTPGSGRTRASFGVIRRRARARGAGRAGRCATLGATVCFSNAIVWCG